MIRYSDTDSRAEERLADLAADLVERAENSAFLARLFALEAGRWEDVATLCQDLAPLDDPLEQFQGLSKGALQVTWLDYPPSTHGPGYCLIIFFAEELHWNSVALYNKRWFVQKDIPRAHAAT